MADPGLRRFHFRYENIISPGYGRQELVVRKLSLVKKNKFTIHKIIIVSFHTHIVYIVYTEGSQSKWPTSANICYVTLFTGIVVVL